MTTADLYQPAILMRFTKRFRRYAFQSILPLLAYVVVGGNGANASQYYGHEAVLDKYGVIAPWYHGLNGQCDFRVRIAAETLKRYPWTTGTNAVAEYPAYVFDGTWKITSNGVIAPARASGEAMPVELRWQTDANGVATPRDPNDWADGDLSQRAVDCINGFVDYYCYTGDAVAIAHITYFSDFLVDHCVTPSSSAWPGMLISVPVKGKIYQDCDPHGMIQLDLCAAAGKALLRAYELAGNQRWFEAAKHWGDLLAEHCNLDRRADPWPRYANPEDTPWKDNKQTGGVTMILSFLDELKRLGYTGQNNNFLAAREAGQRYLREKLLPAWLATDTWGRYFWDWVNDCQNCLTTPDVAGYMMDHPADFPNWRCDARNILTLFLNRSSVNPESDGDIYSGSWAYPEATQCCGRSLWYSPITMAPTFAQYAVMADSSWMRELAYRQLVLQTYDAHETGVTEDDIDGGIIVNNDWFNIAHPLPLRFLLKSIGWLPEELGANRENHIVRSSAVVNSVIYGVGRIDYSTFDAPVDTVEVLRLSFLPRKITADNIRLKQRKDLSGNGFTVKRLANGDAIVSVRHDQAKNIVIVGDDPQRILHDSELASSGPWIYEALSAQGGNGPRMTETAGASITARFIGNQVRLIGKVGPVGGLADVDLDGMRQLVYLDCWNPSQRLGQVLYYRNGLTQGPHILKITARGRGNPHSGGARLEIESVQISAAGGECNFPSGTGPHETQRLLFGYPGRSDYKDSAGHAWRPGTEFVSQVAPKVDTVAVCWWTNSEKAKITRTADPELYRYGIHGRDFCVNLTVGPGNYYARVKLASTHGLDTKKNRFDIRINGNYAVTNLDVAAAAGATNQAFDLVLNNIKPRNGSIKVRFTGVADPSGEPINNEEAFVQAIEIGLEKTGKTEE